ncbi:MAG TPA: glycosyltransferase family 4 protein [Stellaceae bacterium]|nr:glycosyltransferase family 4 protein [Stellaceae bacterium]
MLLLTVAVAAFVVSCFGTRALVAVLRHRAMLDLPNERSSHVVPTPRGGGIAVIGTSVAAWLALGAAGMLPPGIVVVALAGAGLALVSWLDDLHGLSPGLRLLAQFAAVAAGMWVLPHGAVFQGWLPPGLDAIAAALLWVWFVNLFNFMDGIDGIAGSEAAAIGAGIVLVAAGDPVSTLPAAAVVAAALGFLVWNWAPARIFLGDVGSVPLGYLLGYLLYALALRGAWAAALILPLYFLADATLTLLRRLARGERVWQAHREHFYQRAVQLGLGHAAVVRRVIAADIVLIACAYAAAHGWGFAAIGVAGIAVVTLLVALSRDRS